MHKLILLLSLTILISLSCSRKTEQAVEEAMPVKTYKTLKTRTDSIRAESQRHSNTLDSIAGN